MNTNAIIGNVITRSHSIEKLLRKYYPAAKGGLHAAVTSVEDTLPAVLARTIRVIATVRNSAAHPDDFNSNKVPLDFERLCDEIELLIPYFSNQKQGNSDKIARVIEQTQLIPAPTPAHRITKSVSRASQHTNNVCSKDTKQWTAWDDKILVDAYQLKFSINQIAKTLKRSAVEVRARLRELEKT